MNTCNIKAFKTDCSSGQAIIPDHKLKRLHQQYLNDPKIRLFNKMTCDIIERRSSVQGILSDGHFTFVNDPITQRALDEIENQQKIYVEKHYSELFNK